MWNHNLEKSYNYQTWNNWITYNKGNTQVWTLGGPTLNYFTGGTRGDYARFLYNQTAIGQAISIVTTGNISTTYPTGSTQIFFDDCLLFRGCKETYQFSGTNNTPTSLTAYICRARNTIYQEDPANANPGPATTLDNWFLYIMKQGWGFNASDEFSAANITNGGVELDDANTLTASLTPFQNHYFVKNFKILKKKQFMMSNGFRKSMIIYDRRIRKKNVRDYYANQVSVVYALEKPMLIEKGNVIVLWIQNGQYTHTNAVAVNTTTETQLATSGFTAGRIHFMKTTNYNFKTYSSTQTSLSVNASAIATPAAPAISTVFSVIPSKYTGVYGSGVY